MVPRYSRPEMTAIWSAENRFRIWWQIEVFAAEAMGRTFVTTELGGGGTASAATAAIARRGLRNLLIHARILAAAPDPAPTRWLDMPSGDCFTFAEDAGLLEPLLDLGAPVAAGQPVARIHPATRTGLAPVELRARLSGLLAARHFPGLIQPGDCAAVVAAPL